MRGTINRLREHGIQLAQVSAYHATDFCIYYENVLVSIVPEPHPVYPPISAIGGGPSFHPNCIHVFTPFVERLATSEPPSGRRTARARPILPAAVARGRDVRWQTWP